MKVYTIALFLLILNISMGLVLTAPLFTAYAHTNTDIYLGVGQEPIIIGDLNSSTAPNLPTDDNLTFNQILQFMQLMWGILTGLPHFLASIGLPVEFATILGTMVVFVYIVGAIQFLTGRWLTFGE